MAESREEEARRVFGECGGKCGEAPCIAWNQENRRRVRESQERQERINGSRTGRMMSSSSNIEERERAIRWGLLYGSDKSILDHKEMTTEQAQAILGAWNNTWNKMFPMFKEYQEVAVREYDYTEIERRLLAALEDPHVKMIVVDSVPQEDGK